MTGVQGSELAGRTLAGRFKLTRLIGEGGMATVYAATIDGKPGEVAVKVIHPELARDRTVLRRFAREAQAAFRLEHPNTVKILHQGVDGEHAFLVMELVRGENLHQVLNVRKRLPQGRAARILMEVCSALEFAHEQNIVHRDLKPGNIMLLEGGDARGHDRVKILDFGIAKMLDTSSPTPESKQPTREELKTVTQSVLTRVGTIVGTPAYMSPEQCQAKPVDPRSDLYTCGVLLYEMVTGRLPFEGDSALHVAMKHAHEAPPPPSKVWPKTHSKLEAVILTLLAKSPDERFQSAKALRAALGELLPMLDRETIGAPAVGKARPLGEAATELAMPGPSRVLGRPGLAASAMRLGGGPQPMRAGASGDPLRLGRRASTAPMPPPIPEDSDDAPTAVEEPESEALPSSSEQRTRSIELHPLVASRSAPPPPPSDTGEDDPASSDNPRTALGLGAFGQVEARARGVTDDDAPTPHGDGGAERSDVRLGSRAPVPTLQSAAGARRPRNAWDDRPLPPRAQVPTPAGLDDDDDDRTLQRDPDAHRAPGAPPSAPSAPTGALGGHAPEPPPIAPPVAPPVSAPHAAGPHAPGAAPHVAHAPAASALAFRDTVPMSAAHAGAIPSSPGAKGTIPLAAWQSGRGGSGPLQADIPTMPGRGLAPPPAPPPPSNLQARSLVLGIVIGIAAVGLVGGLLALLLR